MQASLPPSSIWMGIMPAFLQMLMPVSPPVKLRSNESSLRRFLKSICMRRPQVDIQEPRTVLNQDRNTIRNQATRRP